MKLSDLPSVSALAGTAAEAEERIAIAAAKQVLGEARATLLAGESVPSLDQAFAERCRWLGGHRLRPVINATGIVVHTNLGRAPWSATARDAALQAAGYCDLEMDLTSGERGGRLDGVARLGAALVGAEDTLVVNNGAAAVLLALTALARDREVICSRGELVEIGGSFRVPDVIEAGGAKLVAVGTTNRTHLADFRGAIGEQTGALLKVHPSNFRISGFVGQPHRSELVALAAAHELPLIEDAGSGHLVPGEEPTLHELLKLGVDLVICSGDKLLGGPQAGLIFGKRKWTEQLRRHPLYRALRVDKVVLAALEATLAEHLSGADVPVAAMVKGDQLLERSERLAHTLRVQGVECEVVSCDAFVGGGSLPMAPLEGHAVALALGGVNRLAKALRTGEPAVVARVQAGKLLVDLRAVPHDAEPELARRLAAAIAQHRMRA